MANTLKFGNGTWATKKGSTLAFNDEDGNYKPLPFTTTRASSATRVNKEGLIEVVEGDRPRIDYTDSEDGVFLLEKAATNLITYSEDFSNAYWAKDGANVTDGQSSPDGKTNAYKLTENSSNGVHRVGRATFTANVERTFSFFAKKGDRKYICLFENNVSSPTVKGVVFNLDNGTFYNNNASFYINVKIEYYTNGWYRCSAKFQNGGLSVPSIGVSADGFTNSYQGDGTSGVYIYGAMLEENSVASSYIPTQGSTVTRVADTASGAGNSEVFNDSEGVLFADISALANDGTNRMISLSDGVSTTSNATLYFIPSANQIRYIYEVSAAQQCSIVAEVNVLLSNKCSAVYKLNRFELWVNGFKVGEDTSGTINPEGTFKKLSFLRGASQLPFYGKTKEIGYYDTVLTDLELETLTSYRSLNELVTELNLKAL